MGADYNTATEIVATTQKELDAIPIDYMGRIVIRGVEPITVTKNYNWRVEVRGDSKVTAEAGTCISAEDNSFVVAKNASVRAKGHSIVIAKGRSNVIARDNSSIVANDKSSISAWDHATVEARGYTKVYSADYAQVETWESSKIDDDKYTTTYMSAKPNQICSYSYYNKVYPYRENIFDAAHIKDGRTLKSKHKFFIPTHKDAQGRYFSANQEFEYKLGETVEQDRITVWCTERVFRFSLGWKDFALLEVQSELSDIFLPETVTDILYTSKIKVLREVSIESVSISGRIFAKQHNKLQKI